MHVLSQFLLQINLGALLTASLTHTSFKNAVGTSYMQLGSRLCKIMLSRQSFSAKSGCGLLIRFGRFFSITKTDWGLESCLLYME